MGDNISSKSVAVAVQDSATKEYINSNKKLLKDIKKIHKIIMKADGKDIPILLKLAQKNLTNTSNDLANDMIKELQGNFTEDSVQDFIEHSISLISSIETANHIYGSIMDIDEIRKHLSFRVTKQIIFRSRKLMEQLKLTNFEDKAKLIIIVDQLNLCIKVFDYCWDIYTKNIKALKETNYIIEVMIHNRIKLGLDNYSVEVLRMSIDRNQQKISASTVAPIKKDSIINEAMKVGDSNTYTEPTSAGGENKVLEAIEIEENNTTTSLVETSNSATDKFIDITNKVIKEVSEGSSNDFMNVALQKFYSIIGAIETTNYLKGNVINKKAVSLNISYLLTEMIYSNYTAIAKSWSDMQDKNPEDYTAYQKEIKKYTKILKEAYDMAPANLDALKKCVSVQNDLYLMKDDFKFKKYEIDKLNAFIEENLKTINETDKTFKIDRTIPVKEVSKKKKGLWSKIFN